MNSFNLHIFVIFCIKFALGALPTSLNACPNKSTEEFNSCLQDLISNIKTNLATGDFGDGFKLQRLEPLFTKQIVIDTPDLKINMTESNLLGISSFKITSVKSDLQNLQFDIGIFSPILNFNAKYSLHQHFKSLKVYVKAIGDISGIFKKARSKIRIKFIVNDDLSVKLEDIQYKLRIADAHFDIESLIVKSDDSDTNTGTNRILLKEIANNFINADPGFILRKVEPKLEQHFMAYLTELISKLLKDVKLKDFFTF